jgi:tetratricopeptide (TPR) repeat protein
VGALIAVPPYNADISWRNALSSQELTQVELALTPSYLTPSDSSRLANAVTLMEQSKLYDQSYKYAKYAVEFNPDYFDAWKILYYVSKSTPEDKKNALANLKRLDPLNPDVLVVPK